jgi:hypothetical protein
MKNLFLSLVLLLSVNGFTQSHNDTLKKWYSVNKLAVEKEFVRLIDSARSSLLLKKTVIYRSDDGFSQKELRTIVKKETAEGNFCQVIKKSKSHKIFYILITKNFHVVKMEYDSLLSLAAGHHAKYLSEVVEKSGYISHEEYKNYSGYIYNGSLPILEYPSDRVKYYCPSRYYAGECLIDGIVGHIATLEKEAAINYWVKNINHINVKSVAKKFFEDFKSSKKHWEAFMRLSDIDLMGVYFLMNFENSQMEFVTVMGKDKEKYINPMYDVEGLTLK